jgi:hypothetical protein
VVRRKSILVDGNNALYHFYDPLSTVEKYASGCHTRCYCHGLTC